MLLSSSTSVSTSSLKISETLSCALAFNSEPSRVFWDSGEYSKSGCNGLLDWDGYFPEAGISLSPIVVVTSSQEGDDRLPFRFFFARQGWEPLHEHNVVMSDSQQPLLNPILAFQDEHCSKNKTIRKK